MATFSFKQPLTLAVAFICMAMAAAAHVSAVPTQPSQGGEPPASTKKKLQGGGGRRNIDNPTFAADKMRFYILSKGHTPPSGPSKKHNRRVLQFIGGGEDEQTVFPAISAKQSKGSKKHHYKDISCGKSYTIIIHPGC